jgi:cytochrome c oxidase assembly factor CtaG
LTIAIKVGLEPWSSPAAIGGALVLSALLYLHSWFHLRRTSVNVISAGRAAAFLSGLFLVWVAVGSPLAALDQELLSAHMAKHLLLMTVASPLILLGAPSMAFLHGLPPAFLRLGPDGFLRSPAAQRLGGFLTAPLFCWLVATSVLIGWHFPAAYKLGMESHSWHAIEQGSFFAAGILFWWPVIPPRTGITHRARWPLVLYLFLATLPCDALSAFLVFCGRVVYTSYLGVPRRFAISPLQDQEFAGALMWTSVTFAYLIPAVFLTASSLSARETEERGLRSDCYRGPARWHI